MFESFNEFVNNEASNLNDPIAMRLRAAKAKANKKQAEPVKKEMSPAKAKKLAKLQAQRAEIMRDMEQEAEMEGGDVADRYGAMLNKIDKQIAKLQESVVTEAYDGNMADFKYEFPDKFEDVTGNPVKAIKKMAKKGKGFEVRTSIYMSRPEMEEVGKAMGLIVTNYEKHSNIAITIYESVANEDVLCEATVEMDAMDPDNKDFLKFLAKNKVNIISKEMDGQGGGTPVITMQGKRKDLEKVLADGKYGWDDADLAEYIEESVVNEARSIAKIQKEWGNVTAIMKDKVDAYKKAKGQEKEDLLDELKTLTVTKKKLEAELDAAVGLKDVDAELVEDADFDYTVLDLVEEELNESALDKTLKLYVSVNQSLKGERNPLLKKQYTANAWALSKEQRDKIRTSIKDGLKVIVIATIGKEPIHAYEIENITAVKSDDLKKSLKGTVKDASRIGAKTQNLMRTVLHLGRELTSKEYSTKKLADRFNSYGVFMKESTTNEGKVTLKRKYTENYPAVTAGKQARIRNKMLEAIADGKLTQEEFNAILKEMSIDSSRWVRRNSKYFNVSEEGISLSKFGRRALNQITINENMDNFMFESFEQFNASKNEDTSNETLNERYVKTAGYNAAAERIEDLARQLDPNSRLCKGISKGADNVAPEFKEMKKHMDEIYTIWQEIEYTIEMSNESVVNEASRLRSSRDWKNIGDELGFDGDKFVDDTDNGYYEVEYDGNTGFYITVYDHRDKEIDSVEFDANGMGSSEIEDEMYSIVRDLSESVDINEAFKSSKLRNLLNMDQSGSDRYGQKASKLAQGLYGISKIKLDDVEDADLIDLTPNAAYREASKSKDFIVFYIIDNEKENPYADSNSYRTPILRPGILAVTRGKDFLGVTYDHHASRASNDKRGQKRVYDMDPDKDGVGGNKNYRGYDASGIYNVKRAADLADRAIVFDMAMADKSAKELIQQRADAQYGAIAFKSDADFKKANMTRYKDILAQKASKLPLDKMVEDAINTLTKHIADGIKSGEKTQYGEIKLGQDKRGRDIKATDAANIMSGILGDYQRYVGHMTDAEREKDSGYSSGYYERSAKEYAKRVSDSVKKVKNMDYAW